MNKRVIQLTPLPMAMPKCWDKQQDWDEWLRLNPLASPRGSGKTLLEHFCVDCTPEYAASMTRQGRCAYPNAETRPEKMKVPRAE